MVVVIFSPMPVIQETIDVQLEPGEDELAVEFKILWPSVEVLSL